MARLFCMHSQVLLVVRWRVLLEAW